MIYAYLIINAILSIWLVLDAKERKVDGDPEVRAKMVELTGRTSVPQIFIGERHVGGCDELHALDREGRLDGLLAANC